jgi:hypothetical protein
VGLVRDGVVGHRGRVVAHRDSFVGTAWSVWS